MENILGEIPRLSNMDLLQKMAMLANLRGNEQGKELLQRIMSFRIGTEIWHRLDTTSECDNLREQTIASIVAYVRAHPGATQEQLAQEIQRHIDIFVSKLEKL